MITNVPPSPTAATEAPQPQRARKPSPSLPAFRVILHKIFYESLYLMFGMWVILACVIMAIVYTVSDGFTHKIKYHYTLLEPGVIGLAIFFCAFLGFLLAFAQFRAAGARDQWALLVHRPIARSRLFILMLLSGLTFYVICAGIPLAALVLWAFYRPDVMPTWEGRFLLPYVAATLTGLATYSCGILFSQSMGRRLLASLLALGNCGLAIAGAFILAFFHHVMVWEVLLTACNLLAAWGAFMAQGEPRRDAPKMARAGKLGAVLGLYFLVALIANPLAAAHLRSVEQEREQAAFANKPPLTTTAQIQPLSDGHFGIVVAHYASESISSARIPGDQIPGDDLYSITGAPLPGTSTPKFKPIGIWDPTATEDTPNLRAGEYLNLDPDKTAVGPVQYLPLPKVFIPPADEWRPAGEEVVFDSSEHQARESSAPHVLMTTSHVYISQSAQSSPSTALTLDPALADLLCMVFASTDGQFFYINYESVLDATSPKGLQRWLGGQTRLLVQYERSFDATGKLIDSITNDGTNPILLKYDPDAAFIHSIPPELYPTIYLTGIGYSAGMSLAALPLQRWFGIPGYADMPFWEAHIFFTVLFCNVLTVAVLILFARRYRLHRLTTAAWIPASLLLGPLMILMFIGFHTRPVRQRCPACRRPRPVNESACPHCKTPFPAPAPTGTEIFATPNAAPS